MSVPSPQPDNRAGPVPDWGQLVAAEGREGGGGGRGGEKRGGWVVGIRHRCLTCVSGLGGRGTKNQTALGIANEEQRSSEEVEEDKEKDLGNQRLLFFDSHTHPVPLDSRLRG